MEYAELHCLSNFTFQRGASHPQELVERAVALGYRALALTDECSLAGMVRAHEAARQHGLHLIVGTELRLTDGPALVLLVESRIGYANLCRLISRGRRAADKGRYRLWRTDLESSPLEGCLALWLPGRAMDPDQGRWMAGRFPGRCWLAVELFCEGDDADQLSAAQTLGGQLGMPLLAAGDVHMHDASRRALQDALTAIRLNVPLDRAGFALYPNGERHLRSPAMLQRRYPAALLQETVRVARRCRFDLGELRHAYPSELTPPGLSPARYLQALARVGMDERWRDGAPAHVRRQVGRELALIEDLGYEAYLLTVYDVVRYARSRGILCQGRGSAANSALCYCLGITAVDPTRGNLLFERFISRERNEPPDIDVDFEHERREEVIQYIYDKYGRHRAALAATVISYRPRSAVRDLGKALGLTVSQIDALAGNLQWWDAGEALGNRLREVGLDPNSPRLRHLLALTAELVGMPRHLSQHVGGFVIIDGRLDELVPVENAAMAGRTVIQWDKDDLDAMGLMKVDILALGMLSVIRRALETVAVFHARPLALETVPAEDPAVYEMLSRGDAMGVFQVESRAQMAMLPRLRPQTFYDLVIEVAIVRPGPIQGDMVHPYLARRAGEEPIPRWPPELASVLSRTLGVPLFQEQAMRLAVVAAGFSPGEADALRRAMAAWRRRGGLTPFRERLIGGMVARGYEQAFAERLYRQIEGFGEYGFPESHAASFALLVYVSAWLKCHYPAAFLVALLNSQPMGFYAPAQLIADARRHGVTVLPVDVLTSDWEYKLVSTGDGEAAVRVGLRGVKGLSRSGAERLLAARDEGLFDSLADLLQRAMLGRRDADALAAAGAFSALAGHRHQARWEAAAFSRPPPLLPGDQRPYREPPVVLAEPTPGQDMIADYDSLGFTLGPHPLALLRPRLGGLGLLTAAELGRRPETVRVRVVGLVINRQRPATAAGVIFITLEDETGHINLVIYPGLLARSRLAVLRAGLLEVRGRIQRQAGVTHVVAEQVVDRSAWLGRLQCRSRDFQ